MEPNVLLAIALFQSILVALLLLALQALRRDLGLGLDLRLDRLDHLVLLVHHHFLLLVCRRFAC